MSALRAAKHSGTLEEHSATCVAFTKRAARYVAQAHAFSIYFTRVINISFADNAGI